MGQIFVYDTEGKCLHPRNGKPIDIGKYFESVNYTLDARNQSNPVFEAYIRVKISGQPEQVFLRYEGDSADTLFEDCREAIETELLQQANWELQEPRGLNDPYQVFFTTVMEPPHDPRAPLRDTIFAEEPDLIKQILLDGDDSLTLTGRNYAAIGKVIRAFAELPIRLAVVDDGQSSDVDLLLRQKTHREQIEVPDETRDLIRNYRKQHHKDLLDSNLDEIEKQLKSLKDLGIDPNTVRQELSSRLSNHYPSLSVRRSRSGPPSGGAARTPKSQKRKAETPQNNQSRKAGSKRGTSQTASSTKKKQHQTRKKTKQSTNKRRSPPSAKSTKKETRGAYATISGSKTQESSGIQFDPLLVGEIIAIILLVAVIVALGAYFGFFGGFPSSIPLLGDGGGSATMAASVDGSSVFVTINNSSSVDIFINDSATGQTIVKERNVTIDGSDRFEYNLSSAGSGTYNVSVYIRNSDVWIHENVEIKESTSTVSPSPISSPTSSPTPSPSPSSPTPTKNP